jgi:YihY family inner membrane protein
MQPEKRTPGSPVTIRGLFRSFKNRNAITLSASVSFFAFLSLFPFLMLIVSVASLFLERKQIYLYLDRLLTPLPAQLAGTVMTTVQGAMSQGKVVSIISVLFLMYSSFAVFGQLQIALNRILGTRRTVSGWTATLKAFGFFLGISLLLVVLVLASSMLFVLVAKLNDLSLVRSFILVEAGTLAAEVLLFSLSYRYLAYRRLRWKSVILGALVAALSWETLKFLFGWYITRIDAYTAIYGSLGIIFLLMIWQFYSILIFFFGAHIAEELS